MEGFAPGGPGSRPGGSRFETRRPSYVLTRRQRLRSHLGVWAPYLPQVVGITAGLGGGAAWVCADTWWGLLLLLPLLALTGRFWGGLLTVALVRRVFVDLEVREDAIGFALDGGERWWVFADGILSIERHSPDVWTISHWNGTVIPIPVDAIDAAAIDHLRACGERGRTPEGVQAVVERGRLIEQLERRQAEGEG